MKRKASEKRKKASWPTIAILLLMLAGLGVMFYPTASDMYSRWQAQREIAQYNRVLEAEAADYT